MPSCVRGEDSALVAGAVGECRGWWWVEVYLDLKDRLRGTAQGLHIKGRFGRSHGQEEEVKRGGGDAGARSEMGGNGDGRGEASK